jgi:starch synthase
MSAPIRPVPVAGVSDPRTRVLFVNAGILGMQGFSTYIRHAMAGDPAIDARHIDLSEHLTTSERLVRRALCARFWRDGLLGLTNLDFARLRQEFHAGLQAARRIRRTLSEGVDVLHFHRQGTAYASIGLMRRIPSIVSIDCTQDAVIARAASAVERRTYGANAAIDGRIFRAAAAIVSTSDWAAACLRQRYPDCPTPVHVMPTPVRAGCFDEAWIDERASRPPGRPCRVLFIGGDFVRKGGEDLLAAWQAGAFHRRASLDLVSNWPIDVSGVPGVRLVRHVVAYSPEWLALWREADVFVLPSRSDAFANVFLEAGAAGLPSIAARVDAVPEVIVDGVTGLIVPPCDPAAIARALRTLLDSPDLRRRYGRAARAHVLARADPDVYRSKLRALIREVAADRPSGRARQES